MTSVATAISSRLEARFAAELAQIDTARLVRRCADVEELLTAAEAGEIDVAAISPDFPGINGSIVAELTVRGATVLGVVSPTSPTDARQCEAWALGRVHLVGSGELVEVMRALERVPVGVGVAGSGGGPPGDGLVVDVRQAVPLGGGGIASDERAHSGGSAHTVVVWGPGGAPGRTTCAVHLAHVLSRSGPTLLIDADTVSPGCAPMLGLLDEAPGILAAARLVDAGSLTVAQLRSVSMSVAEGFDVLTGIGRATRWQELSRFHVGTILERASQHYRWIVVDVAADLTVDEALLYDTVAPARSGAGLEALERCDTVLAIAGCDPIALQRFVVEWGQFDERLAGTPARIIISKARSRAIGGAPEKVVPAALERFLGASPASFLPDARDALDDAVLRGELLTATHPTGPYARAVEEVARGLGSESERTTRARARRAWSLRR